MHTRARRSTSVQLVLPPAVMEEIEGGRTTGPSRRDSETEYKLGIIQKHGIEQSEMYFRFAPPRADKPRSEIPTRRRSNFSPAYGDAAKQNAIKEELDAALRRFYNADDEAPDEEINSRRALLRVSLTEVLAILTSHVYAARIGPF